MEKDKGVFSVNMKSVISNTDDVSDEVKPEPVFSLDAIRNRVGTEPKLGSSYKGGFFAGRIMEDGVLQDLVVAPVSGGVKWKRSKQRPKPLPKWRTKTWERKDIHKPIQKKVSDDFIKRLHAKGREGVKIEVGEVFFPTMVARGQRTRALGKTVRTKNMRSRKHAIAFAPKKLITNWDNNPGYEKSPVGNRRKKYKQKHHVEAK